MGTYYVVIGIEKEDKLMKSKHYWRLAALILLIGTASVFITLHSRSKVRQLEKALQAGSKQQTDEPVAVNKKPSGASPDGHWPGDGWHQTLHGTENPNTLNDGKVTTFYYNEEIPEISEDEFIDMGHPLDTIDVSDISGDADYIHSYKNLVIGFVQLHADHFPDCQEHEAVMADAKAHALWTLQKRDYDKKSKRLDLESNALDNDFAELTGGDINKFLVRVRNASDAVQKDLKSQMQTLVDRSAEVEQKRKELIATRVPYTRPKHLHD